MVIVLLFGDVSIGKFGEKIENEWLEYPSFSSFSSVKLLIIFEQKVTKATEGLARWALTLRGALLQKFSISAFQNFSVSAFTRKSSVFSVCSCETLFIDLQN
jgi:hypothetical protein